MVKPSPPAGNGWAGAATVVITACTGVGARVGDDDRLVHQLVAGDAGGEAARVRRAVHRQLDPFIALLAWRGRRAASRLRPGCWCSATLARALATKRIIAGTAAGIGFDFGGERQHGGAVAQLRAVVGAVVVDLAVVHGQRQRRGERRLRTLGVAIERQAGSQLGTRHRAVEVVDLRVGVIAQVADRGLVVARQHIERVGDLGRALLQVDVVGERVLQVARSPAASPRAARRSSARGPGSGSR